MTAIARARRLGGTGIETTALGFGCADLFREADGTARQRLLGAAFHAGISHFDVAPMYGLGLAEAELGRFARDKRNRIVIATKFGIDPTAAARLFARVQQPVRRILASRSANDGRPRPPGVDPRLGLAGRILYGGGYGPRAARASLERSLRALQTDHVDILFLHDPMSGTVISDEVRGYLEQARAAGHIRAWGVAGETRPALEAARRIGTPVPAIQVRGDLLSRAQCRIPAGIADAIVLFGVIGRPLNRIMAHVRGNEPVRQRWTDALGVDCGSDDAIADLLLADAVRANAGGPVLFSTTRIDRIARAAVVARTPNGPAIDALRALVTAEIAPAEAAS